MYGIANVGAIVVLCYLMGILVKASPIPDKWIPVIVGIFGGALGIIALSIGFPEFPATDYITAAAIGVVSGLSAVGINQIGKQLLTDKGNDDTPKEE